VYQSPLLSSRTPNRSCRWHAEAVVDGKKYIAESRTSSAREIARQLLVDGVVDGPMEVFTEGLRGSMTHPSFHRAAGYVVRESATIPVRLVPWRDPGLVRAQFAGTNSPK
jgi:hypothetical protein